MCYRRRRLYKVWKQANGICALCGGEVPNPYNRCQVAKRRATLDHITPRSKGGSDRLTNLQLAHSGCNSLRGDMFLDRWREKIEVGEIPLRRNGTSPITDYDKNDLKSNSPRLSDKPKLSRTRLNTWEKSRKRRLKIRQEAIDEQKECHICGRLNCRQTCYLYSGDW